MNGVLCINKPTEYTSFDVIARIRGMSRQKRVGHSGTLDPMATGVLPIFIGTATKACDILSDDDKEYVAKFKLGVTTDTLDIMGKIKQEKQSFCKKEDILNLLSKFTGTIKQIPPMYSAVRVNGQRLYDIARQGIEIHREAKTVTVYSLKLLDFNQETQTGELFIACSKGTYIRTIIDDIGALLNVGAIMTSLCRTKACGFCIEDCITLEQAQELTNKGILESKLMETEKLFTHLPAIKLDAKQQVMFINGVKLELDRIVGYPFESGMYRIYGSEFLGIASPVDHELIQDKLFYIKG